MNTPHENSATPGAFASRLKGAVLAALVILNAALAVSLTGILRQEPSALAGSAVQGARISDYMIIPSHPLGLSQDVLFILDTENARLTAAGYDSNRGIEFTTPIDLRRR